MMGKIATLINTWIVLTVMIFLLAQIYKTEKRFWNMIEQLHEFSNSLNSLEKKMYQLERNTNEIDRSFKQSQSEIFKWQESLQTQLNHIGAKNPRKDSKKK